MYEQGLSLRKAAAQLSIPHSTAQSWKKKYEMGEDVLKEKKEAVDPRADQQSLMKSIRSICLIWLMTILFGSRSNDGKSHFPI